MLESIGRLRKDTVNIFVCCPSPSLQFMVRGLIADYFDCYKEYRVEAKTSKDLTRIKHDIVMPPMIGRKWLVEVEMGYKAGMPLKDILNCATNVISNNSVNLIWVSGYGEFKKLKENAVLKEQGTRTAWLYGGNINVNDLYFIIQEEVGPIKEYLTDDLINYVSKTYLNDPQAIFTLARMLQSGMTFKTKQDLIAALGTGRNTLERFTMCMLAMSFSTERGYSMKLRENVKQFLDIHINRSWHSIRKGMIEILDCCVMLKQQIILGNYTPLKCSIPHYGNAQLAQRCRAYGYLLFDRISLQDILVMRELMVLTGDNDFVEVELTLLRVLYTYAEYKMARLVGKG